MPRHPDQLREMNRDIAFAAFVCAMTMSGCHRSADPKAIPTSDHIEAAQPWFEEIGRQAGLNVTQDSGHRREFLLPETVCGGAALFDMDNDGLLDLYIVQCGHVNDPPATRPGNRLYRNDGNGHYIDVTDGSGADDHGLGMGVATGDYDNDGDVDLYITNLGPNVLLRNDGHGRFTDVTAQANVGHAGFGSAAAFLDYDGDGLLDLFVVNYIHWSVDFEGLCTASDGEQDYCSPRSYRAPSDDVLYHNDGGGVFTDVTAAAGMAVSPGNGLGVACVDFNDDGLIDIYVANDLTRNRLWVNLGGGRFEDRALELGCAIDESGVEKAGMGVTTMDQDGDGDADVLVGNLGMEPDSCFRNHGTYFVDVTAAVGLSAATRKATRFGMGLQDFNNDGRLDLFEANGRVNRDPPLWSSDPYAEPNLLMRGTPDGRFEPLTQGDLAADSLIATSRAAVFGDIDNDGGIDIVVINRDERPHLLRNIVHQRGHWIMFRALDTHRRDALGATVLARIGTRTVRRDVQTAYSFFAANDPRVHIGLGDLTAVDNVTVRWPDGRRESFGGFAADQIITLQQGAGTANPTPTGQ